MENEELFSHPLKFPLEFLHPLNFFLEKIAPLEKTILPGIRIFKRLAPASLTLRVCVEVSYHGPDENVVSALIAIPLKLYRNFGNRLQQNQHKISLDDRNFPISFREHAKHVFF